MNLSSLRTSITDMERGNVISLILEVRNSRRTSKKVPTVTKSKTATSSKPPDIDKLLKGMDKDMILKLLEGL